MNPHSQRTLIERLRECSAKGAARDELLKVVGELKGLGFPFPDSILHWSDLMGEAADALEQRSGPDEPYAYFDTNEKKLYPTKAAAHLMGCIDQELIPLYRAPQSAGKERAHITAHDVILWAGRTLQSSLRTDSEMALAEAIARVANGSYATEDEGK